MKKRNVLWLLLLLPIMSWGLTIDQAVDLAKQNNKDLQKQREEMKRADAQYRDVRGNLMPQLSLGGSYTLEHNTLPDASVPSVTKLSSLIYNSGDLSAPQGTNDQLLAGNDAMTAGYVDNLVSSLFPAQHQNYASLNAQLKLTQNLFVADVFNGLATTKQAQKLTANNYQLQERDVVYNTKDMFNQLLLLQEVVKIQQEALDIARQHDTLVTDMYEQGLASEYDKLRADLEVSKLEPDLIQAQNNLDVLSTRFRDYIGWHDGDLTVDGDLNVSADSTESLQSCIDKGLQDRLELNAVNIGTEIYRIQLKNARQVYLPKVALTADYTHYSDSDDLILHHDEFGNMYTVGVGFSIPLFTGFSNESKIAEARSSVRQSEITKSDLEDKIELQVRNQYLSLQHSRDRLRVQQQNITLAQRGLEIAQARYENHIGIELEVLDAQLQLRTARLSYLNAAYDVIMNELALHKATGEEL